MRKWLLAVLGVLTMAGCDTDGNEYDAMSYPTSDEIKAVAEKEYARILRLAYYARDCAFTSSDDHLIITGCDPFRRTMRRSSLDLKSLLFRWGVAARDRQETVLRGLCGPDEAELCAKMALIADTRIWVAALTQRHRADYLVKKDPVGN